MLPNIRIYCTSALIIVLLLIIYPATMDGFNAEPQVRESVIIIQSDWNIPDGIVVTRENVTIKLTGDLRLESGGKLIFHNVNLIINCSYDGEYHIEVYQNAEFKVFYSNIYAENANYTYKFNVNGSMQMENSSVSDLWGQLDDPWFGGVQIMSDSVIMKHNTIFNCRTDGIQCRSVEPIIEHNIIHSCEWFGIWCNGSGDASINNNKIFSNQYGIGCDVHSSPDIENNIISDNNESGINLEIASHPRILSNTITDNGIGIRCWDYCSPFVKNNDINSNFNGIVLRDYSRPIITDNDISSNENVGVYMNNSHPKLYDNIISSNGVDGVRITKYSNPTIENCSLENNGDDGIQCNEATVIITDCRIYNNEGDGILVKYDSEVSLENCIFKNSGHVDLQMKNRSIVSLINSSLDKETMIFNGTLAKLVLKWHLEVQIVDDSNKPVEDAYVNIENGDYHFSYGTKDVGTIPRIECIEYIQQDKNGDRDGNDENEIENLSFIIVNATKTGHYSNEVNFTLTKSTFLTIILERYPPPKIISSSPENDSTNVNISTNIIITFDRDVLVNMGWIDISDQFNSSLVFDMTYNNLNFSLNISFYNPLIFNTTYEITINNAFAVLGDIPLNEPYVLYFRTEPGPKDDGGNNGEVNGNGNGNGENGSDGEIDTDGDGFNDTVEEELGYDPKNPDSHPPDLDDDYVPDPLDDDRDGDDVPNSEDDFPDDPERWKSNKSPPSSSDSTTVIAVIGIIIVIIMIIIMLLIFRKKSQEDLELGFEYEQDEFRRY